MNNTPDFSPSILEERTDILFREIEMAARWERPAILFAIYRSESVRDKVMEDLEQKLTDIGQKVHLLKLSDKDQIDSLQESASLPDLSRTIIFLDGNKQEDDQNRVQNFELINKYREYFIDNSLRAVFWLCEKDVQKFASRATECWYLRHRVIDFTDEIKPAQVFLNTLESCMQAQPGDPKCPDPDKLQMEIENLTEELNLKPSHATVLYILGLLWTRKNDLQNAQKFLHAALDISNITTDTKLQGRCLNAIATVQARLGNANEAISLYRQAIPLSSKPGSIWKNIGILLSDTQEHQQSVEAFLNALQTSPQDHSIWVQLGNTYLKLGLFEKAGSAFETALELSPSADAAWTGLGQTHLQKGEPDQAAAAFQKAIHSKPENTPAWIGLGQCHLDQQKEADAMQAFQKAADINPENVDTLNQLGELYLKQQKYDLCLSVSEKAIQLQPESGEAYKNMAIAEYQRANHAHAAQLFEQAIPLFEDRETRCILWKYLAETHLKLNDNQKAVSALKQAVQLSQPVSSPVPESPLPEPSEQEVSPQDNGGTSMMESKESFENHSAKEWSDLGNSYLKTGAYKKAVSAFTRAIEMAPDNSWPYIKNLAIANYEMGKRLGKRLSDQSEDPNLLEAEDEEEEISTSVVEITPQNQMSDASQTAEELSPTPDLDLEPMNSDPLSAVSQEMLVGPDEVPSGMEAQSDVSQAAEELSATADTILESMDSEPLPDVSQELQVASDEVPAGVEAQSVVSQAAEELSAAADPELEPVNAEPLPDISPVVAISSDENPLSAEAWNAWGNKYATRGDFDNAIEAYKRSIQTNPRYGLPYSNLGFLYFKKGDYRLATLLYQKSIDLLSTVADKATTLNRLGDAFHRLHRYEDAFDAYKKARDLAHRPTPIMISPRISILQNSMG